MPEDITDRGALTTANSAEERDAAAWCVLGNARDRDDALLLLAKLGLSLPSRGVRS
jgi:hypothetical protein